MVTRLERLRELLPDFGSMDGRVWADLDDAIVEDKRLRVLLAEAVGDLDHLPASMRPSEGWLARIQVALAEPESESDG